MEKIAIREQGLVGTLFREGKPSSGVIVLGGSSGGCNETRAQELAKEGFAALALAYFAVETLPPTLKSIPLEYFEKAIARLKKEPGIEKVALWGGSRGAELSLLLGTLFPDQISALVAHVPSSVVYGVLEDPGGDAWIYQGKPLLPRAPFQFTGSTTGETEDVPISVTPSFLNGMQDKAAFEAAAIPVEKLKCPLLLISAEDDQMWPSTLFAQQIIDRLHRHRSSISYSHIRYKNVGHAPSKGQMGFHPILKRWFSYGGNATDNAHAAKDWLSKTVQFFKQNL
jgi:pimeloyl-ACP methyl ester carboxylesterase